MSYCNYLQLRIGMMFQLNHYGKLRLFCFIIFSLSLMPNVVLYVNLFQVVKLPHLMANFVHNRYLQLRSNTKSIKQLVKCLLFFSSVMDISYTIILHCHEHDFKNSKTYLHVDGNLKIMVQSC